MQKIFVGNKPIILTTELKKEIDFKNILIESAGIEKIISTLKKDKYKAIHLIGSDLDSMLKTFLKLLPNVVAAGGKVLNSSGRILFIFRNGKWDLPKGKAEKNENISQTAIREVFEETGILNLSITKPLEKTFHIFKRGKKHFLKSTYWFEMKSNYSGEFKPQKNEGITRVEWIGEEELDKILLKSYANIRLLI